MHRGGGRDQVGRRLKRWGEVSMERLRERTPVWRPRPLTKYAQRPGAVPESAWHAAQQRKQLDELTRSLVYAAISLPAIWLLVSLMWTAGS